MPARAVNPCAPRAISEGVPRRGATSDACRTAKRASRHSIHRRVVVPPTGRGIFAGAARAELYTPDLRSKSVAADTSWDTRSVPHPDETPAAEALGRTLRKTGLEFRGVEVVAAP